MQMFKLKPNNKKFYELFEECEQTRHNVVNPQGQIHTAFCSKCGCEIALDDDNRAIKVKYK